MVIDEALVRALLDGAEEDAALILLEGRAQVFGQAARASEGFHGTAVCREQSSWTAWAPQRPPRRT
ncbi:hypothetical protein ACFRCW_37065 [Streptomyces sp. NPDC056653]|uniref:hypothetical protein n=1 Tax=Streptomyces sp. NPDC056653 TaxID=3345894 RepID=UPI0036808163